MDAEYFQEKAATCLRLADELPLNHPARVQLLNMAKDFQRRATELGAHKQQADDGDLQHRGIQRAMLLQRLGATVIIQYPPWFSLF